MTRFQVNLARRSFIALVGGTGLLVVSCGKLRPEPEVSAEELGVRVIIKEKSKFITAAIALAAANPNYASPLKIVVEHNELHIAALTKFATLAIPEPSESAIPEAVSSLPRLSAQCAEFSASHLDFACSGITPELSRTLGLIAGSEIMHHAFLNALV